MSILKDPYQILFSCSIASIALGISSSSRSLIDFPIPPIAAVLAAEAVAEAVSLSDKLKKERRSAIQTLVIQGYIIFFVFLAIILIMQFYIIPLTEGISGQEGGLGLTDQCKTDDNSDFSTAFLFLLLSQGFFSGLTIGLLAEGNIKSGIKHSFSLMILSFLVSSAGNLFFEKGPTDADEIIEIILSLII